MGEKQKYLAAGALAGLANGFFGAGGGVVLVPLLLGWIGLDEKKAFATSVFIILPISALSAVLYWRQGRLDLLAALPYLVGGFAGGLLCGKLYHRLPALFLRRAFGALLIVGGVRAVLR